MADSDAGPATSSVSSLPCFLPDDTSPTAVTSFISRFLTKAQVTQLGRQFLSLWEPNRQVMWTGIICAEAQEWARRKRMRTLSIAMGPLLNGCEPPQVEGKGKKSRTRYMRGASALFAWYITADEVVTVLCPPPPERFNPGGATNFQLVELPILTGILGGRNVSRIDVVHPMVKGAEDFNYQLWPVDQVDIWVQKFALARMKKRPWLLRARTSQILEIENLLRSMPRDSDEDPIYHAMLPQAGTAISATTTKNHQRIKLPETDQRRVIVRGNDAARSTGYKGTERNNPQVAEKKAGLPMSRPTTTLKAKKSKIKLKIHQQEKSEKPASSKSQTPMKTATCDKDVSIRVEPSSKGSSSVKSFKSTSTRAPPNRQITRKNSPGNAGGETSTTGRVQADAAVKAGTSAARNETSKCIAQGAKKVGKTKKKNKQKHPGPSKTGHGLEAGKSGGSQKAGVRRLQKV